MLPIPGRAIHSQWVPVSSSPCLSSTMELWNIRVSWNLQEYLLVVPSSPLQMRESNQKHSNSDWLLRMNVFLRWFTICFLAPGKKKSPLENFISVFNLLQTWRTNQDIWRHLILFTPFQRRKCNWAQNIFTELPLVLGVDTKWVDVVSTLLGSFCGWERRSIVSNGRWILKLEHA